MGACATQDMLLHHSILVVLFGNFPRYARCDGILKLGVASGQECKRPISFCSVPLASWCNSYGDIAAQCCNVKGKWLAKAGLQLARHLHAALNTSVPSADVDQSRVGTVFRFRANFPSELHVQCFLAVPVSDLVHACAFACEFDGLSRCNWTLHFANENPVP
jgi:hypothetical protein